MKNDSKIEVPSPASERSRRFAKPTKEAVRAWLLRVIAAKTPPPEIQKIQDDLWYVPRSQGLKDEE